MAENIPALDFDGRTIFGVADTGGDLITIDPATGEITTIGPIASGPDVPDNTIDGIAFACPRSAGVPTMSAVGLAFLAAALLALGAYAAAARARRQAS